MLSKVLVFLLFQAPLSAATVSLFVVEEGLPPEMGINENSYLWENSLLDAFFDAGHIVSNIPALRLSGRMDGELPEEVRSALEEAVLGGMDYFILVLLEYPRPVPGEYGTPSAERAAFKPGQVFLKLFRTSPFRLLFEQRYGADSASPEKQAWIRQEIEKFLVYLEDTAPF